QLLIFSIPILLSLLFLEVFVRQIPNDYSYKRDYLDKNANLVETLFLGNSHIYFGINPEHMGPNTFNGAHISQSLDYDYKILSKYQDRWKELKFIIIPM